MTTSAILGIPYIASQQSQPDVTHNEAVSLLQIILAGGAIQIGLDTPPGSPAEGDVYVIGDSPTGVWAGRPNSIAGFFLSQWLFVPGDDSNGTPIVMGADQEGLTIWSKVDNAYFTWTDLGASPDAFTWRATPGNITQLSLLDDTNISSPVDNDILQFVDGLWANRASGIVFFSSDDHLPAPVSGVITLKEDTIYWIAGSHTSPNRLVAAEGSSLTSGSINGPMRTYSGVGTMLTGVGVSFDTSRARLSAPSAQVFDFSDGGSPIVTIGDVQVEACAKFGTFNNLLSIIVSNSNCLDADDGVTLSGTSWTIQSFVKFALVSTQPDFIGIDLGTSVAPTIEMDNLVMVSPAASPSTSVGVKGLSGGGNLPAGAVGTVTNSSFFGGITPLEGITTDDVRWSFADNSANVESTMPDGLLSLSGNATTTTVSGGVPALVAGTWTVERGSHFEGTAAGRLTYVGERPLVVPINVIATVEPASGTNKDLEIYLALNGTFIPKTKMIRRSDSGNPGVVSTMWQLKLEENDFLEVFVANATDDVSPLVSDAIFRLR